ncbi:MAG: hypothetical protein KDC87_09925 [Planctomycetes bacterium]|nr:hypothetical protein [Planctomycetota bacterium]MCB9869119.1 hypothetical protein [Planctomycetota bacterium]
MSIGSIVKLAEAQVDLPGRISMFFQVRSPEGKPVPGLDASSFVLEENQQLVSTTESSQRLLARPQTFRSISLLLLDRSNSVATSEQGRAAEITAAKEYIRQATTSPNTFVGLAWFDGRRGIHWVLDGQFQPTTFSNDAEYLLAAIENLHTEPVGSGSTNLYGAILAGLDELDTADQAAQAAGVAYRSLTLVTFTDGTDQAGIEQLANAQARVDNVKYSSFTIGLGLEISPATLQSLGKDGFVTAERLEDLAARFRETATTVRDLANSFYVLAYCSPKQDGSGTHTLTLRAYAAEGPALVSYEFSADYFSGGCGFVDTAFVDPVPGRRHVPVGLVEDDSGAFYVLGSHNLPEEPPGNPRQAVFLARFGADGRRDDTFGRAGVVTFETLGSYDYLTAAGLAKETGGSLVIGLNANTDSMLATSHAAVLRVSPAGVVLASTVLPQASNRGDFVRDLAVDHLGRIVLSGDGALDTGPRTTIWRLAGDLTVDAGFATGGVFHHAVVPSKALDTGLAVAIDTDDSIVCIGTGTHPTTGLPDGKVVRLLPSGALDPVFGNTGLVLLSNAFLSRLSSQPRCLGIDALGRIVVGGTTSTSPTPTPPFSPSLWRMSRTGQPDTSFAGLATTGTGRVGLPVSLTDEERKVFGGSAVLNHLVVHKDGNILATGNRTNGQNHTDMVVWNFSDLGRLVPAYNSTGFLIEDGSIVDDGNENALRIAVGASGRIFAVGTSTSPADPSGVTTCLWVDAEPRRVFAPFGAR